MNGPENRVAQTRPADPRVTGIVPLDSIEPNDIEPVPAAPSAYRREPLFNKKVMLMWAIGTATVWFAVKFITPLAVQSARTAIIESVNQANEQQPGATVTITRNGKVITIRRAPAPPPAATPAAQPAAGAAKAVSAESGAPEPAAAEPAPSARK